MSYKYSLFFWPKFLCLYSIAGPERTRHPTGTLALNAAICLIILAQDSIRACAVRHTISPTMV
jgi:hypothetical protein